RMLRRLAPAAALALAWMLLPAPVAAAASPGRAAVLADHPVLFYPLDEPGGTTARDASGHGNDGTYAPAGVHHQGGAIVLTGTANPVTGPASAIPPGDHSFTLEGWFRTTAKQDEMVVDMGLAAHQQIAGVGIWDRNTLMVDLYAGAVGFPLDPARTNLRDGRWHMLDVTYDAGTRTLTVYADGVRAGSQRLAAPMDFRGGAVRVGYWVDTIYNRPFNGAIRDVAIFWQALPAARIAAHADVAFGDQATVATSITPPELAFADPRRNAVNAAITLGVLLFITFPSQLFNHTFQENYEEIRRWLGRSAQWADLPSPAGFAAVVLIGAALGTLLDPHWAFNRALAANYPAMVLAILTGIVVPAAVATLYRRRRHGRSEVHRYLQALPAGLLVAALCVLVSRATAFRPGYLYGVIASVGFTRALEKHEEGHVIALSTLATLIVGVLAWFLWVPVEAAASSAHAPLIAAFAADFLASVFLGALVGTVISLLPLEFLPGKKLADWHRGVWALAFAVAVFGLMEVVLRPVPGPAHPGGAPLLTAVLLFVAFGGGSLAFRAHFARRKRRRPPQGAAPASPGTGTGRA
ncbi:MAG: FGLLP motif-containing membrane protein, partial [Bacillota bacterium]|nr:FGLLP motif-containing membrane protein [Bacillota bacterium]